MTGDDPMAKYVEGMPDELQDMLRGWSDRIARDAALDHPEIARAADQGNQPNPTAAPPSICTPDGPADPPVCGEVCRYCPIPTTDEGKAEYDRRFRALTEEGET